jgi:hypothetical protein
MMAPAADGVGTIFDSVLGSGQPREPAVEIESFWNAAVKNDLDCVAARKPPIVHRETRTHGIQLAERHSILCAARGTNEMAETTPVSPDVAVYIP